MFFDKFSLAAAAGLIMLGGIVAAPAPAYAGAYCDRHPGDYLGHDGRCHLGSDRHKREVTVPAVYHPPGAVDAKFGPPVPAAHSADNAVEREFREDCTKHLGTVYTAEEWNKLHSDAHLQPGQLHCHAEANWYANPPPATDPSHADPPKK